MSLPSSPNTPAPVTQKQGANIYTVMLILAFLALTTGSILLFLLVVQVVTGIVLALYYVPSPALAYDSVRYIMERVTFGRTSGSGIGSARRTVRWQTTRTESPSRRPGPSVLATTARAGGSTRFRVASHTCQAVSWTPSS